MHLHSKKSDRLPTLHYKHYESRIHQLQGLLILSKCESEKDVAIERVVNNFNKVVVPRWQFLSSNVNSP